MEGIPTARELPTIAGHVRRASPTLACPTLQEATAAPVGVAEAVRMAYVRVALRSLQVQAAALVPVGAFATVTEIAPGQAPIQMVRAAARVLPAAPARMDNVSAEIRLLLALAATSTRVRPALPATNSVIARAACRCSVT